MEEQLVCILQGLLAPEVAKRSHSEQLLLQVDSQEGFCLTLLKISSQPDIDVALRQLAAIQLKNTVKRRWARSADCSRSPAPRIPDADRRSIMTNLHECVVRSPREVQAQLLEVTRQIASHDFPDPWDNLLPDALASLACGDPARMYGSLQILRKVASSLEFCSEHAQTMQEFSRAVLPVLVQLMWRILSEDGATEAAAVMLRVSLKIFYSCIFMSIPECLVKGEALARQWLQALLAVMQHEMPIDVASPPHERENSAWWKLRKWLLRVANRLFDRYGDPKIVRVETARDFAALFLGDFSYHFLKCVLEYAMKIGQGHWASRQSITYICRYISTAAKQSGTQVHVKPYLLEVLTHVALPLTFFSAELHQEWKEDPMEVIRRNSTALMMAVVVDLYDPRDAAISLVRDVMRTKALRETLLDMFMKSVLGVAAEYTQCDHATPGADLGAAYKMDGAMLVLGALLEHVLVKQKQYKEAMETIARQHVLPLFRSSHPFLRAKAVWVAGVLASEVHFSQPDGTLAKGQGPMFDELFELTLRCMKDEDLPVQVEAVNAFRAFVEQLAEAGQLEAKLQPILKDLLLHFFEMASLVEAMDVIMSVDAIIEHVGESIQPYAVECCRELVGVYARVVGDADADQDNDMLFDQGYHILQPIIRLLEACSNIPKLMRDLEELLLPILQDICNRCPEDLFEQVCEILGFFTYFSAPLSERLWSFWPVLENAIINTQWGTDYCEQIVVPLDNFIARGKDVFLSSSTPSYKESVYRMVQSCFSRDLQEDEVRMITKLLDIVLLNCRGHVDEWVWPFCELCINKVQTVMNTGFATLLMNVVASAFFYNVDLTLKSLEAHGRIAEVFTLWFNMIANDDKFFRRLYDKKLCCAGLICLLSVPQAQLPTPLTGSMHTVLREVLKMLKRLKEQEEARQQDGSDEDAEEDVSDQAVHNDLDLQEDDTADEDEAYLALLAAKRNNLAIGEEEDEDAIVMEDWTDDEEIESALDDVDVFSMLVAAMNNMQDREPERFQAVMGRIDDCKGSLHDLMQYAHIRRADKSHEKMQPTA
eukprot:jgi/Ulvmu1/7349/UM036_0009.1